MNSPEIELVNLQIEGLYAALQLLLTITSYKISKIIQIHNIMDNCSVEIQMQLKAKTEEISNTVTKHLKRIKILERRLINLQNMEIKRRPRKSKRINNKIPVNFKN